MLNVLTKITNASTKVCLCLAGLINKDEFSYTAARTYNQQARVYLRIVPRALPLKIPDDETTCP